MRGGVTLEGALKNMARTNGARHLPTPMVELLYVLLTFGASEAIAESYGHIMEVYHDRFCNPGKNNEDNQVQSEMFVHCNGPPKSSTKKFFRRF